MAGSGRDRPQPRVPRPAGPRPAPLSASRPMLTGRGTAAEKSRGRPRRCFSRPATRRGLHAARAAVRRPRSAPPLNMAAEACGPGRPQERGEPVRGRPAGQRRSRRAYPLLHPGPVSFSSVTPRRPFSFWKTPEAPRLARPGTAPSGKWRRLSGLVCAPSGSPARGGPAPSCER